MRPLVIGAILVILISAVSSRADIYEWVDENGTVTFKDTPPPTSKRTKVKVYSDVDLDRTLPPQKTNPYKHHDLNDKDKDEFNSMLDKIKDTVVIPAENGNATSQAQLGRLYKSGAKYDEAIKWLTKAAEQGEISAMRELFYTYYGAEGVEQDKAEGLRWLRKLADKGDKNAKLIFKQIENGQYQPRR